MKYKLTKKAWVDAGLKRGWVKQSDFTNVENLMDVWDTLVTVNWTDIAKVLVKSLNKSQYNLLDKNNNLSMDGFDINIVDESRDEDYYWLDVDIKDMNKFRSYLKEVSPNFVNTLESTIPELTDKDKVTFDFNLGN